jgi:hypothetical protein
MLRPIIPLNVLRIPWGIENGITTCIARLKIADELKRLMPIQNNGTSSNRIANIAKRVLHTPMPVLQQIRRGIRARPKWEKADLF